MRMNSRCGIARRRDSTYSRRSSSSDNGSPPEIRQSRTAGVAAMYSIARSMSALRKRALAARTDEPGARAIATVDRAEVRHEQQHAIGIAVHQARDGAVPVLAERIVFLTRAASELCQGRNRRPAQPLSRVHGVDQTHVIRRDADRQRSLVPGDGRALLVGDGDDPLELLEATDAVAVLPAPVVPFGGLHTREVALAELVARRADDEASARRTCQLHGRREPTLTFSEIVERRLIEC